MPLTINSDAIRLAPLKYRGPLVSTIAKFEIQNLPEFLGTLYYESTYLTSLTENLNYTCDALLKKYGRHRISYNDAMRYGRRPGQAANQEAIANCIYGGKWGLKELGNKNLGDGWWYRGQGPIQLTGLYNWEAFSKYLKRPEIGLNPHIALSDPQLVCDSAGWYWTELKDLNDCGSDMRAVTKLVTGAPDTAIKTRTVYRDTVRKLLPPGGL